MVGIPEGIVDTCFDYDGPIVRQLRGQTDQLLNTASGCLTHDAMFFPEVANGSHAIRLGNQSYSSMRQFPFPEIPLLTLLGKR